MKHKKIDEDDGYAILSDVDKNNEVHIGMTQDGIVKLKHGKIVTIVAAINISKDPEIIEEHVVKIHVEYLNNKIVSQVREEREESIKRTAREVLAQAKRDEMTKKHKATEDIPELLVMEPEKPG